MILPNASPESSASLIAYSTWIGSMVSDLSTNAYVPANFITLKYLCSISLRLITSNSDSSLACFSQANLYSTRSLLVLSVNCNTLLALDRSANSPNSSDNSSR